MNKEILIAILMSAINYIVVQTINSRSQQTVVDYFKQQIDELKNVVSNNAKSNQDTLVDELKTGQENILSELKEQSDFTRQVLKENIERIDRIGN